jgi:glycosyltransferase involved in cell wall biosynthesis
MISNKQKRDNINVCMLSYSFYAVDGRVRRYAERLVQKGNHVDVLSLGQKGERSHEVLNGVHVYRIQKRSKNEKGKLAYLLRMIRFLANSGYHLAKKHLRTSYDLIHVHSVPDFEVFATILPKLLGAKVILDIHDPMPDFYLAKFGSKHIFFYNLLSFVERISTGFSDHVITVTDYWMKKIAERSKIPLEKISTILNLPDIKLFNYETSKQEIKASLDFILLYPGTINKHCGLHLVIKAINMIRKDIPSLRFHIYGAGTELESVKLLVKELELQTIVFFHSVVPLDSMPGIMFNADAGIALLAGHDDYAQQALNVKLFEFLSMGLPTIATRTKSVEHYITDNIVMLSEPNSIDDIARCIRELYKNPHKRNELSTKGLEFIRNNNSKIQMDNYLGIVDRLTIS